MSSPPVLVYRFGHWFYKIKLKPVGKFISYINRLFFSTWLPSSAVIGKNFKAGYWGLGTVVHSNTQIGDNVTIGQNVTIGRNFGDKKVPVIGNDVYIGAGTVVFGEIIIGNNVIIGSNSVINKSIPDNSTVAGNPFRIIAENRQKKYYEIDNKGF
ncbi:MAG: acetyltransferase [Crocinitomicaceae bacterium]|jgi:serine O-acetyltransferase|nr:acetyltransferase [Crocinitomicaceae bacterium]